VVGQHVPAEGEDPAVVAVVERLEGGVVPGAESLEQPLVAGGTVERASESPRTTAWCDDDSHAGIIDPRQR
jgi:hypothetical protein